MELRGKTIQDREQEGMYACIWAVHSFIYSAGVYWAPVVPDPLLGLGIAKILAVMEFIFY